MSDLIDQRIVEMSFENHKFEKGILESKNSLKDFSKVLEKTTKTDGFSGLEKSVGGMSGSFSAFQQVAIGALRRIGEQAVMTGAQLLNSLTLAPITQGFNEMELKMNSTQTIMASTGESLAKVNAYLQELNEYSDKTIYSFSDMTSNIGKFTNAGVKLDMAVASIKGISNAAALAGANSNEASRAMYNFAQALSSGYVKLIDWKSIELANMATVEFKTQLLESAVAAGTLAKTADGMYKVLSTDMAGKTMDQTISATRNFNDSLSYQWMTTDALTKTLANYADETTDIGKRASKAATQVTTFTKLMDTLKEAVGSGWAQTFEIIFGDFNEARDLWTGMNDTLSAMISATSDSRNNFLGGALSSGWKLFMQEGIADAEKFGNTLAIVAGEAGVDIDKLALEAGSMEKAVKGAWLTGEMLTETVTRMADEIENLSDEELALTGYTKKNREEMLKLRDALKAGTISAEDFAKRMSSLSGRENIIQGLKNSVLALLTAIKPVSQAFDQIFPPMTANRFFSLTETFQAFTKQLIIGEETADKIKRTFAGLFAVIDIGWQVTKLLGGAAFEVVKAILPLGDGVLSTTASLGDFLVALNQLIKSTGVFQYGLLGIKVAMAIVRELFVSLVKGISDFATGLWNAEDPLEYLADAGKKAFGGILDAIKMVTNWLSAKFNKAVNAASNLINSEFGQDATGVFGTILKVLKEIVNFLGDGAISAFTNMAEAFKNLDFGKITAFVAGGILLLFIKQLSDLTGAMAGFTNSVTGVINKIAKKFFTPKTGNTIHDIAVAIGVLTVSLWLLSTIPAEDLSRGLIGLASAVGLFVAAYAGIQAVQVIASKVMKDQEMVSSAFNLVGIAAALAIMAGAVTTISKIDSSKVMGAVGILGLMLGFIVAYQALSALISKIPGQTKVTMNLMGMSAGLLALVGTIAILSQLSYSDLNDGLGKLTTILVVIASVQTLFSLAARIGGGKKATTGILGMAVGIAAMIGVLQLLGMIDSGLINRGLPNLAKLTLIIAGINAVMGLAARIGGGKKAKTNLLAVSLAMSAMIAMIAVLSMFSDDDLSRGIKTLAAMGGIISGIEVLTAAAARIAGGAKVQKILGSVSITMLAFTGIIALLAEMDQADIDRGLLTITAMVGIIAAIEAISVAAGKIGATGKTFGPMISAITGLIALTALLMILSLVDQQSLMSSAKAIAVASVAMVAMSIAMANIMQAIKSMARNSRGMAENVKALVPGIIALGVVLGATLVFFEVLKSVLPIIASTNLESFAMFVTGLGLMSALMIAFSVMPLGKSDFVKSLLGMVQGFAAMAAVLLGTMGFFGALALILPIVDGISWDSLGKFSTGLVLISGLLILFGLLAAPLAAAGAIGAPMLGGVAVSLGALALVIAAFTGIAAAMSLVDFNVLSTGFDNLTLVGEGIGRFVGAIIGGIAIESLTGIGEGLSGFANSLGEFNPENVANIKSLAEAILIITGASLLDGISRFFNFGKSSMDVFGEQLVSLIGAFTNVPVSEATNASNVMSAMGPMASNLKALAEAAQNIPNSGGFIGDFMGNNDIDVFGGMLARFVRAFSSLTVESTKKSAAVLDAMAPMGENLKLFASIARDIPNSGGFIGDFMGNNDIDVFGGMLSRFVNVFAVMKPEDVKKSVSILSSMTPMANNLKTFANAAQSIPNSGGFIEAFVGNNDIDRFGTQLASLIGAFSDIDQSSVTTSSSVLKTMAKDMLPALRDFSEFSNGLKNSGGFLQAFSGNTTLSEFGNEFVRFVNALKGADFSVVKPAMDALSSVTETINGPAKEDFAKAFTNLFRSVTDKSKDYERDFKKLGNDIIEGLKTGINDKKQLAVSAIKDVMSAVVSNAKKTVDSNSPSVVFETLGKNCIDGLTNGFTNRKKAAVNSVTNVMKSVVDAAKKAVDAHSPSRLFDTIGGWCTLGLANGITRNTSAATAAGTSMANATEEAIRDALGVHSLSEKFADMGQWLPDSLATGAQNGKGWLMDTAKSLGIDTSKMTVSGITEGLAGGEGIVTTGINSLIDALTGKTADAAAGAGSSLGNSMTSGMQSALSNSSSGLGGSKTQSVVKSEIDKLKTLLEDQNFYGQVTLKGELEAYEVLRAKYKEGSEERKELDKEVYTRLKTIYETEKEYIDSVTEAQREAAEERTKIAEDYNSGVEEARKDADKKLADAQKKYDDGVSSAKDAANKKLLDADKKYYEGLQKVLDSAEEDRQKAREQYAKDQKTINDQLLADIDAQNKAYENAVKSRADAIAGSYGLFDKVEEDEEVSGTDLLENLRDQGAALSDWKQQLEALKERGVGDELIEELQKMGPSSKAQIKALLTLTDEELTEYVSLFKGKYTFARVEAEKELVGLKDDTSKAIKDLNDQAAKDLAGLEEEFKKTMSNIDSNMASDMSDLKSDYSETLAEINSDLSEKLADLEDTWSTTTAEVNEDLREKLSDLEDTYNTSMQKVNSDLEKNLASMKSKYDSTLKEIKGLSEAELRALINDNKAKLAELNTNSAAGLDSVKKTFDESGKEIVSKFDSDMADMNTKTRGRLSEVAQTVDTSLKPVAYSARRSGENVSIGFAQGIDSKAYMVRSSADNLAVIAGTATQKRLDEHSPSKLFHGFGEFVSIGFANGITDYASKAEDAGFKLADGPIAAVSAAMAQLTDDMSDDWSPTITPVLDLSQIDPSRFPDFSGGPTNFGGVSGRMAANVQNGNPAPTGPTQIINQITMPGMIIRSDADVDMLAVKLQQRQDTALRGKGIRTIRKH